MADATRIDWCDATINPWGWGCYGPGGTADKPQVCWYCYARRRAHRRLRDCPDCQAFRPHWHAAELEKPLHWRRPRRIFVQSMGDPFGEWVTQREVHAVFDMMARAPQHTYLFLTKQPQNILARVESTGEHWPQVWLGASVDTEERAHTIWADMSMSEVRKAGWHTFVSIEPMLTTVQPAFVGWAEWVIVGALSGPLAQTYQPSRKAVETLLDYGEFWSVPVFLKASITRLWPDLERKEWPNA